MSISYIQTAQSKGCNDSFSSILRECAEEFKTSDLNIFRQSDYMDVMANESLHDRYVDMLAAQLDSDEHDSFMKLCKNNRMAALEGASIGNVAPMSYLQDPMMRKSWARLAMPHALPTEAVEKPKFTLNYYHPWIMNPVDGVKHYAPEDLADVNDAVSKLRLAENMKFYFTRGCFAMNLFTGKDVDMAGKDLATYNWATKTGAAPTGADWDKYAKVISMVKPNDDVDINFAIIKAGFKVPAVGEYVIYEGQAVPTQDEFKAPGAEKAMTEADLEKNIKIQIASRVTAFKGTVAMEVEVDAAVVGGTAGEAVKVVLQDNFYGDVDIKNGHFSGTSVAGRLSFIMIRAFVSSMMNNANIQVGFDIRDKEIDIGTGEHMEAPVPNEYVTDLLRMFSFQGVTRLLEILSQFLAQKVDLEAIQFCDECINDLLEENPGRFVRNFSAKPTGSYTMSPLDWQKVLTKVIDHLADSLINKYHFEQGYFTLLCNPLDAHLLPEVNWVFQGSTGNKEHSGVTSNFSLGSFQGIHTYNLVSSPNVPQGYIRVLFIPTVEDQMTYKFFPYSFTIEQPGSGYNSPINTNVPSIMTHRRYTFQKLLDACGKVNVLNNGESEYNFAGPSPYLPSDSFVG